LIFVIVGLAAELDGISILEFLLTGGVEKEVQKFVFLIFGWLPM